MRPPSSIRTARCRMPPPRSASWCAAMPPAGSKAIGTTPMRSPIGCAAVGSGREIWPIAMTTECSGSPDAWGTGCGLIRRTSRSAPSRESSADSPTRRPLPSSGCPIRWPETRFWWPSSCGRAARFDPDAFAAFLDAQSDLGTKWAPRFVRVMPGIPVVGQDKIDKKPLRREAWLCEDPVWWRPARSTALCTHDRCRP